jgi:ABC-type protease/lipase transport system fused ATPase/permease subunit
LSHLEQEIEALESCEQQMIARNFSKKMERDRHAAAVVSDLKQLRLYVTTVANGNETVVNMAGMTLKRPTGQRNRV